MGTRILTLALGLSLLGVVDAQERKPPSATTTYEIPLRTSKGRSALAVPNRTDAGAWDGTWVYVNRDYQFALWMTEDKGKPVAKLQFKGNGNLVEAFETDWKGHATYDIQGHSGVFDLTFDNIDDDTFSATWKWDLDFQGSARRESGTIEGFRAGDGRQLVMHFTDFKRVIESASGDRTYGAPQVWTFRKVSKRLALWDELPF